MCIYIFLIFTLRQILEQLTVSRVQQSCRFILKRALLGGFTAAALCEYVHKGFTVLVSTSRAQ